MFFDTFTKGSSFIKKRSQLRFIVHFCGSILIGVSLAFLLFYLLTYREMGNTYYQSLLTLKGLRQNLFPSMVFTAAVEVVIVTIAILAVALIGSNRIAGPVYRMERTLESIGNGDLSLRIRFRKHDAIDGFAGQINSATESLNTKVSDIERDLKELRKEAERLRADPQLSPAILMEKIRLMKKTVSGFKTE